MTNQELATKLAEMFYDYIGTEQEKFLEDGLFVKNICAENGIETDHLTDRDWEEVWDLFDIEIEKLKEEYARIEAIRREELGKSNRERKRIEERVKKIGGYKEAIAFFMNGRWEVKVKKRKRNAFRDVIFDEKTDTIIEK